MLNSTRSVRRFQLYLLAIFIICAIALNTCWTKAQNSREAYLKSLNLDLTLHILNVKPTNNHGFGGIYGQIVKSNKPDKYTAIYQNDFPFCKTLNKKAILITSVSFTNKGDSVVINSSKLEYQVFRNSKLLLSDKLVLSTDVMLGYDIGRYKLFDFKTYK